MGWRSLTPSFIKKTYEHLKKLYDKRRGSSWGCAINIQYTTDGTFSYIHRFQYSKFSRLLSKKRISKYAFSWLTGYSPLYRASNQQAKITNNQWKQRRICPKSHKILLNFFNLSIRTGEKTEKYYKFAEISQATLPIDETQVSQTRQIQGKSIIINM